MKQTSVIHSKSLNINGIDNFLYSTSPTPLPANRPGDTLYLLQYKVKHISPIELWRSIFLVEFGDCNKFWKNAEKETREIAAGGKTFHVNEEPANHTSTLCSNRILGLVTNEKTINHPLRGRITVTYVGHGVQGRAFSIKNEDGDIVGLMKTVERLDSALFETNALLGKHLHPIEILPKYELLKLATSDVPTRIPRKIGKLYTNFSIIQRLKQRCVFADYIDGASNSIRDVFPRISRSPKHMLIYIILLLKQLQAVHFTINHYKYTTENILLKNIANAHGDLHSKNILATKIRLTNNEEVDVPILIDYGLSSYHYYSSFSDVISDIYNNYLRDERHIINENVISANRLYNLWQNVDFCELFVFISNSYLNIDPCVVFTSCVEYRKRLPNPILKTYSVAYLQLFNRIPGHMDYLFPFLILLNKGIKAKRSYIHWILLVDLLSLDMKIEWNAKQKNLHNIESI
ncbi:hypothetical protein SNEBB_008300 [Seison nebaliae]|nr:hypothetical protein SNEBB_008300 [Seison nebaliae]